jgi:hypothetical protein
MLELGALLDSVPHYLAEPRRAALSTIGPKGAPYSAVVH